MEKLHILIMLNSSNNEISVMEFFPMKVKAAAPQGEKSSVYQVRVKVGGQTKSFLAQ